MQASKNRLLRSGKEFDHLFPKASGIDTYLNTSNTATVFDSVATVKKVVASTLDQTKQLAKVLNQGSIKATSKAIWDFIYNHIQYKIDTPGTEQVRSPARAWADRVSGVDCDCYSTFISSVLTNLSIDHVLRMTAYRPVLSNNDQQKPWQHIYVIVITNQSGYASNPIDSRNYITIDPVKDEFNVEHGPITAVKDYPMNLARLDGFDDEQIFGVEDYTMEGSDLGRVRVKRQRGGKKAKATPVVEVKVAADGKSVTPPTPVAPTAPTPMVRTGFHQRPDQLKPNTANVIPIRTREFNRTDSVTENYGTLKNGVKVTMGDIIPERWFNNIFGGNTNGFTFYDRKVLFNGVWDGKTMLMRFWVVNGVLKGNDTRSNFYTDFGNGQGPKKIQGMNVRNPGVALGGLGALFNIDNAGDFYSNLNGTFDSYGLWIDGAYLQQAIAHRRKKLGLSGYNLGSLGLIGEILGSNVLDNPDFQAQIMGIDNDFEDVNGVVGLGGAPILVEMLDGFGELENELQGLNSNDEFLILDGLGRVRRARGRKAKAVVKSATSASSAPTANPIPQDLPATKSGMGMYVPLNTLKNLIVLRQAQIQRLNANGHKFRASDVSLGGFFDSIGKSFSNVVKSVGQAASKTFSSQNLISQAANLTSLIPGAGAFISPIASNLVNSAIAADEARGQAQYDQPQQQQQSQAVAVVGQQGQSMVQSDYQEATAAYNDAAVSGLDGVLDDAGNWVKANPGLSLGIALGGGYLAYRLMSGKGSSKPKGKARAKGGLGSRPKPKSKSSTSSYSFKF